jgi:hypothetical protein
MNEPESKPSYWSVVGLVLILGPTVNSDAQECYKKEDRPTFERPSSRLFV